MIKSINEVKGRSKLDSYDRGHLESIESYPGYTESEIDLRVEQVDETTIRFVYWRTEEGMRTNIYSYHEAHSLTTEVTDYLFTRNEV